MTTLTAKAASFSGNAFGTPIRLRLKAPPEPQDILCGIDIPVRYIPALLASVHPNRKRLLDLCQSTASATHLGSVLRVNRDQRNTSFFRFALQYLEELRPSHIMHRLCKVVTGYAPDVEGFMSYQSVALCQLARYFVVEVSPLVGHLLMELCYTLASFTATLRALVLPGERTLRPPKLFLGLPVVARRLHKCTIRGCKEALQSEVYPDSRTFSGCFGSISDLAHKYRVPLPVRPLDGEGLNLPVNRTVQLNLDMSDLLEVEPSVFLKTATISVGRELNRPETDLALEAGIARGLTRSEPAEERLERTVETSERCLGAGEVGPGKAGIALAGRFKLCGLFAVGEETLLRFIRIPPLCKSAVVEAAVGLEHSVEVFELRTGGTEPVLESLSHPTNIRQEPSFPNDGGIDRHREEVYTA